MAKNTICLWYDKDAEAAARFYAATFPDSRVGAVHRAPSDYPSGRQGDVITVEFTVCGVACIGLSGGPAFRVRKEKITVPRLCGILKEGKPLGDGHLIFFFSRIDCIGGDGQIV